MGSGKEKSNPHFTSSRTINISLSLEKTCPTFRHNFRRNFERRGCYWRRTRGRRRLSGATVHDTADSRMDSPAGRGWHGGKVVVTTGVAFRYHVVIVWKNLVHADDVGHHGLLVHNGRLKEVNLKSCLRVDLGCISYHNPKPKNS